MKKRIFIILKEDIIDFPPILSLIRIITNFGYGVVHLGSYTDAESKAEFVRSGVKFIEMPKYDGKASITKKFISQVSFRNKVNSYLKSASITNDDILWIPQIETIYLLHDLAFRYQVVFHPLEFTNPTISWKYRLISPTINLNKSFKAARAVVCCEYNRAHLTKGICDLDILPFVLPNKPYDNPKSDDSVPSDVASMLEGYYERINSKKVILYQGIFLDKERRLEEFCEAIKMLPEEFILVAMGRGGKLYDDLRQKYEGHRIMFIPFIKPPYHLKVTKEAYIGVLSYFPRPNNIGTVINPLYCAPNKIYEYSKFGKPMISNDIPGLHYIFQEYNCGKCMDYPITAKVVADTIEAIDRNYNSYSTGAYNFYKSEDIESTIKNIINSCYDK